MKIVALLHLTGGTEPGEPVRISLCNIRRRNNGMVGVPSCNNAQRNKIIKWNDDIKKLSSKLKN